LRAFSNLNGDATGVSGGFNPIIPQFLVSKFVQGVKRYDFLCLFKTVKLFKHFLRTKNNRLFADLDIKRDK
jgi:hypothetical protein